MKCPSCSRPLEKVCSGKLELDGCTSGCGGLWFDKGELEKVDEGHEKIEKSLHRLVTHANVVVDHSKQRHCPKCSSSTLDRHPSEANQNIEIDFCDSCGGCWLDMGELQFVRAGNDERNAAAQSHEAFLRKVAASKGGSFEKRVQAVIKLLF